MFRTSEPQRHYEKRQLQAGMPVHMQKQLCSKKFRSTLSRWQATFVSQARPLVSTAPSLTMALGGVQQAVKGMSITAAPPKRRSKKRTW